MSKQFVRPADYIVPLNINGIEGRMLNVAAQSKSGRGELLLIYDLNSNIEQWWGLVMALRRYGNVTVVDLPGLGGMDSFFKIGSLPTVDNFADYLAAFIKLRYKRKKLSIAGIGFGFSVITRMLQRNPELKTKVNLLVCINGYAHHDDFKHSDSSRNIKRIYYQVSSARLPAFMLNSTINHPSVLKLRYRTTKQSSKDQKGVDEAFVNRFKIDLARENDLRTRLYISGELLKLDNCVSRVDKPLWHITVGTRSDINSKLVEQHLRVIFKDYTHLHSKLVKKIPFVFNDEKMAVKLMPAKLRRELKKSPTRSQRIKH